MNTLKIVNVVLLILLSVFSGISKIMQVPQEIDFFQGEMGFSVNTIILFGVAQLIAGTLLVFNNTRTTGAIILAATLCVSTIIIFVAGKIGFGLFSIVPIVMAGFVIKEGISKAPSSELGP